MLFDRYHSKVLSIADTNSIFQLDEDIHLVSRHNKQVIPFRYATRIIFEQPRQIAVMDCPCKAATGTCAPVGCCIAVGENGQRPVLLRGPALPGMRTMCGTLPRPGPDAGDRSQRAAAP